MLRIARKEAARSTHKCYWHGVIITKGGKPVATGHNSGENGAVHAEVDALKKIWPNKRNGCTVWSFRFTKTGALTMAKPCEPCTDYLRSMGIRTVVYSNSAGQMERVRL
jgi:deoxycytidylate deaminase